MIGFAVGLHRLQKYGQYIHGERPAFSIYGNQNPFPLDGHPWKCKTKHHADQPTGCKVAAILYIQNWIFGKRKFHCWIGCPIPEIL